MAKSDKYDAELEALQVELVKTQAWAMETGQKLIVVFEGRDAAGKDGTIRRLIQYLSPRATRVVALPKPSDVARTQWFFQRYVAHLPAAGEWVLFNRSWYNRAGVERVMGFSTPQEQEQFLRDTPDFERMLTESGARLIKLWLDISKKEQAQRLEERRTDPLKLLKTSPLDAEAQKRWDDYSAARDDMLMRTHSDKAPWMVVRADDKKAARLNVVRHILREMASPDLSKKAKKPDPKVLFPFEAAALTDGRLER
jgi:polyphosphate kinase